MSLEEDNEIYYRLSQKDSKRTIIKAYVITSARKYRQNGVFRLPIVYASLHILYLCGASTPLLAKLYRKCIHHQEIIKE